MNRRIVGTIVGVVALIGAGAGAWILLDDDGGEQSVVVSADEGAKARADLAAHVPGGTPLTENADAASGLAADSLMPVDCGTGGEPWVPTAEELASANGDSEAFAAVLDRYGIAYDAITDDLGFVSVQIDYNDVVAQSVADSFWEQRYPVQPPSQADLDSVRAEHDVIAAALDAAGVGYTRTTDEFGWDQLEWDYEDPAAATAVDAAYAELYPPQPPSAEDLALITADNDKVSAAFDAAGIAYTRVSDELGWEWIEWDYEDEALAERVNAVFAELYPIEDCTQIALDDVVDAEPPASDELILVDPPEGQVGIESEIAPYEPFTPEQIAQRDAEVSAMGTGFVSAGVEHRVIGESPWQTVIFDLDNNGAVAVIAQVLASRPSE